MLIALCYLTSINQDQIFWEIHSNSDQHFELTAEFMSITLKSVFCEKQYQMTMVVHDILSSQESGALCILMSADIGLFPWAFSVFLEAGIPAKERKQVLGLFLVHSQWNQQGDEDRVLYLC